MIYITGDTHGDIDYKKLLTLKEKNLSYDDYLIICGDAGICWSPQTFQYHLDLYNDIGCTIIFIDGNHENFEMLNQCPLVEYKGALMHQIDKHIFHVLRGEIMTLSGKTFLNPVLRANYSIDVHSDKKDGSILQKTTSYELPIEALISKNVQNLFAIGMLVGADFMAHSALRVQKSCMSMGEGVAKYISKQTSMI